MIQNSNRNVELFHDVDSAVFCLTLSDDFVENESEVVRVRSTILHCLKLQLMKYSIFGSPLNAYCDKNLNIIVLRDGKTCLQAEVNYLKNFYKT